MNVQRNSQDFDDQPDLDDEDNGTGAEDLKEKVEAYIGTLQAEADRRVGLRTTVEARWLDDLRQYHGKYSPEELARFEKIEGSSVYLNLTRPKTNALMARLWDLLFPTDDRNWGILPTPVPEMGKNATDGLQLLDDAKESFSAEEGQLRQIEDAIASEDDPEAKAGLEAKAKEISGNMGALEGIVSAAQKEADKQQVIQNEAKDRCNLMMDEIDDQLKACGYQAEARDMIADACKIGTGILKGPVIGGRTKQRWQLVPAPASGRTKDGIGDGEKAPEGEATPKGQSFELKDVAGAMAPGARRVDPWSFFPDPEAGKVEDCESFFERDLKTKARLRKFARDPDVDKEAVRRVLRAGAHSGSMPSYLADLSSVTDANVDTSADLFVVWEYTGPVEPEQMASLAEVMGDEETKDWFDEEGEIDPLKEVAAKIWFCNGEVLKFALHPLDSGEPIYSVYNPEEDENSLFGFGLPYLMKDNQAILNGAQRMMVDNAALSVCPQIVINKKIVTPENGKWVIEAMKIWERNDPGDIDPRLKPFEVFYIESNQQHLAAIMDMARKGMDETASLPQIAQGEQGAGVTKTAQGMALLMNSANVVFRRMVKNFDDNVSVPMIRRFYHWNMQFSERDAIKGDYEVDARGASVLLVREMMAQNLIMIAQMFGDHPIYGPLIKHGDLMKQIFRAHMIPASEITKTDREVESDEAKKSEQGDPAAQMAQAEFKLREQELKLRADEIAAKTEIANMDSDTKRYIAEIGFDATMEKLAESMNITRDQLDAKMQQSQAVIDGKERALAVELSEKQRTGDGAGGSI